jgi:hypothetical protein
MADYLLVYHGGGMPETPEAQAKVMKAWDEWFHALGSALVDGGNPASQSRTIASDGSAGGAGANPPSGYSIIRADDIDGAVALAKGCPVLQDGASIEVVETFKAM